ncbi:MAG: phosphoenolpyruvate carboxykinase (ATP), partial [Bacteroidota bacterium]|nr:phosphoenolpyruvate carboxykinase (ATP) [Bacteroidota bacterium]
MEAIGLKSSKDDLKSLGVSPKGKTFWNLTPAQLIEEALINKEGFLVENGALMCDTREFTGRSPKDKFVVLDEQTKDSVWWGDINHPISNDYFEKLFKKMAAYIEVADKVYIRDAYAC